MRSLALIAGLVLAAAATTTLAATYRWVDRNGVVHYSDRPQPGAVLVEMRPAQTFDSEAARGSSRASAGTQTASAPNQQQAPAPAYESFEIFRPANDETIQNSSQVSVRLRLEPVLNPAHSIWLYLDGKRVDGLPTTGSEFTISNVERGTHSLTAVVADGQGNPVIRSPAVTFHVRQTSVLTRPRT